MVNPSDAAVGHGEHVEAELLAYVQKAHTRIQRTERELQELREEAR